MFRVRTDGWIEVLTTGRLNVMFPVRTDARIEVLTTGRLNAMFPVRTDAQTQGLIGEAIQVAINNVQ